MKEAPGHGRRREHADGNAAGRFAEDGHVFRIAAELRDVRLHHFNPQPGLDAVSPEPLPLSLLSSG